MRLAHRHEAYAAFCCEVDGNAVIDSDTGELLELHCPICGSVTYGELGPVAYRIEEDARQ